MKYLLDDMVAEVRIGLQLYTHVVAVRREGGRITGVFTESKSGREFIEADMVIDATGWRRGGVWRLPL
jgi:glycine/D-amino acid oxidase-like deaminating enzyme